MAKGLEKHNERQNALSLLGKDLARRSKSRCELCGASGVALAAFEVPPIEDVPNLDHCLLLCGDCREQLANPKKIRPSHWRCLTNAIWSELPAAQAMAARILFHLQATEPWAAEILSEVYLEDAVEEWAQAQTL